jgi:hypothetical protein
MKPDLLGERERASGKFHWAQTAANRMEFYENCADITEILTGNNKVMAALILASVSFSLARTDKNGAFKVFFFSFLYLIDMFLWLKWMCCIEVIPIDML